MKYIYLFLFCLSSCEAERSTPTIPASAPDGFHLMILKGLPDIETTNQLNFSAKKYRVKFFNVGCVTEKYRSDSIKTVNDSIFNIVKTEFGDNWLRDLHSEIDTINEVRQLAYIEILNRKIQHDDHFYYLVSPSLEKNMYLVRVYTIDYENYNSQIYIHYYLGVDFKKKLVFEIPKLSSDI